MSGKPSHMITLDLTALLAYGDDAETSPLLAGNDG